MSKDLEVYDKMTSREGAVNLPHPMAVTGYIMKSHSIPHIEYSHKDDISNIYHYTNSVGLLGIVSSHRFWATHTDFLNDPSEGAHGIHIAADMINQRINLSDDEKLFFEIVLKNLFVRKETDLFVVSFCHDGDILSQWRGYGNFGAGYAIGLQKKEMAPHIQFAWLIKVIYDDARLKAVIDDVLKVFTEHLALNKERHRFAETADWCSEAIKFISQGFKHPGYMEENETRLVLRRKNTKDGRDKDRDWYNTNIEYRARGGDIIPYIATPLNFPDAPNFVDRLPIREIVLGPGVPFSRNERSIRAFLEDNGYNDVVIRESRTPFQA
ncbi:DUF2971 domain-containing protein [Azospirillum endophyticum]